MPVNAPPSVVLVNPATGSFLEAKAADDFEGTACPLLDAAFKREHQVYWGLSRRNDPSPFGLGLTVLAAADSLRNGSKAACWHRYARLELVQDDAGAWAYREGGLQRRTVGGMGELAGGTGVTYEPLIRELRKRGYRLGEYDEAKGEASGDLFGVPYDWRLDLAEHAVDKSPVSGGTFSRLKALLEAAAAAKGGARSCVVSHSMGAPFFHAFLHGYVSRDWAERHVEMHISLEGAWAGSPKATGIAVSGVGVQEEEAGEMALGRAQGFLFHALQDQLATRARPAMLSN